MNLFLFPFPDLGVVIFQPSVLAEAVRDTRLELLNVLSSSERSQSVSCHNSVLSLFVFLLKSVFLFSSLFFLLLSVLLFSVLMCVSL